MNECMRIRFRWAYVHCSFCSIPFHFQAALLLLALTPFLGSESQRHLQIQFNSNSIKSKSKSMMESNPNRAEAERLLGIAEKLLQNRDFNGSREFAILAQETEPLLEGSDQILAVADVLIADDKRASNHHDWYAILQADRRSEDLESIKRQYRRLALLLHPDKNRFPFADQAFRLVADAWAVLSNHERKMLFDKELGVFSKVNLGPLYPSQAKLPVRRGRPPGRKQAPPDTNPDMNTARGSATAEDQRPTSRTFWTVCPYCYCLYEYPKVYEGCCLKCQNCQRSFHGVLIQSLPPLVPGQEAYYCCWGFFPMGFMIGNSTIGSKGPAVSATPTAGFPNWMPPVFSPDQHQQNNGHSGANPAMGANVPNGSASGLGPRPRGRGRPRKHQ